MDLALIHLLLTASPPYRVAHPLLTAIPPYRVAYSSRWPNNAGKVSPPCFVGHNTFAAALVDYTGGHLESCNVTAPPLSCYTAPKAVKACLDGVPAGRRAVHLNTGIFLGPGNTERWAEVDAGSPRGWTLWADEWAVTVKARFDAWFRELASIGGSVDLVILDFEAGPWWLSEYFRYGAADVGRVTGDSRWPAVRTLLNAAGAPFGVNFDDISDIGNWSTDPSDFRQWVWTDVMLSRRGAYLNHSLYEPARKAFPDVRGVDYDHAMRPAPGPHWAYSYGGAPSASRPSNIVHLESIRQVGPVNRLPHGVVAAGAATIAAPPEVNQPVWSLGPPTHAVQPLAHPSRPLAHREDVWSRASSHSGSASGRRGGSCSLNNWSRLRPRHHHPGAALGPSGEVVVAGVGVVRLHVRAAFFWKSLAFAVCALGRGQPV